MQLQERASSVNVGISEGYRIEIAQGLSRLLADTYTLYLTTHSFHWNVTGSLSQTLHTLFAEQYRELAKAVDEIAERIRALGFPIPGTYSELAKLSSIPETAGIPAAEEMVMLLVGGNETVIRTAQTTSASAKLAGDGSTADLLTRQMRIHEKITWKLRSLLQSS